LFGHDVILTNGATVKADEAYLKESIVNPPAKVVQGYTGNIMPATYGNTLTDQQINDIIEFIKTVK
jgi:cytochrome c oxidase subunit 2